MSLRIGIAPGGPKILLGQDVFSLPPLLVSCSSLCRDIPVNLIYQIPEWKPNSSLYFVTINGHIFMLCGVSKLSKFNCYIFSIGNLERCISLLDNYTLTSQFSSNFLDYKQYYSCADTIIYSFT